MNFVSLHQRLAEERGQHIRGEYVFGAKRKFWIANLKKKALAMCSDEQIELKTLKCMVQRGGLKHVISYVPCFQMLVRGYKINKFCIFPSAIGRRKWAKYHGGMCIWCDT